MIKIQNEFDVTNQGMLLCFGQRKTVDSCWFVDFWVFECVFNDEQSKSKLIWTKQNKSEKAENK